MNFFPLVIIFVHEILSNLIHEFGGEFMARNGVHIGVKYDLVNFLSKRGMYI